MKQTKYNVSDYIDVEDKILIEHAEEERDEMKRQREDEGKDEAFSYGEEEKVKVILTRKE